MHEWVVSFDLNSLYPHLIMHYNISTETITPDEVRGLISPDAILKGDVVATKLIQQFKEKNLSVAANGTTYRKDIRGFLPELMDTMYQERKTFKNKMIESQKHLEEITKELMRRALTK